MTVRCRSEVTRLDGGDFLEEVTITDRTADTAQAQPCAGLFCFIGAEPATNWLTGIATGDDGFIRTDVQLNDDDLGPAWPASGGGRFRSRPTSRACSRSATFTPAR